MYKRQLKDGEETRDYRFEPLDRLRAVGLDVQRDNYELVYSAPLPDGESLEAVSYTHLDVYKRQISPLLANIVLNELDHWVESNWENSPVAEKYAMDRTDEGKGIDKGNGYKVMRQTKLKMCIRDR